MREVPVRPPLAIRPLTIEELPRCAPFGEAFHAEKQVPGAFSIDAFVKNWTVFLTQYKAVLLGLWDGEKLVGGLGGMVVPDLTTAVPTATEFLLFIDPAYRTGSGFIRLVDQFRAFGKANGAVRLRMELLLADGEDPFAPRLGTVYRRRWKLRPVEVGYDGELV